MGLFPLLLTSDVERDSIGANTPLDFFSQSDAVETAITDVQSMVETYLDRILTVRKSVQIVDYARWQIQWSFNYSLGFLQEYPLVKILNVEDSDGEDITDEYSIPVVTKYKEHRIQGQSRVSNNIQVTAYTGYRREDQTLADIQALGDEYDDLDVLPPKLPSDIRGIITKLVLNRLTLASTGQLGTGQKVMGGVDDVRLSEPASDFESDCLVRLADYRAVY